MWITLSLVLGIIILYMMICLKIPTRILGIIRQKRLTPTAPASLRVNYNLPQSRVDIVSDDKVDVVEVGNPFDPFEPP